MKIIPKSIIKRIIKKDNLSIFLAIFSGICLLRIDQSLAAVP
jgi:hypothetical protein